jgi:hypothetical protein
MMGKRHARFAEDGIWAEVLTVLLTEADAAGQPDWQVSVDLKSARAHRSARGGSRSTCPACRPPVGVETRGRAPQADP